jgi:hypothetical protein
MSWAKIMRENIALGATLFGSFRSNRMRRQIILQAAQVGGSGASATFQSEYYYWNVRAILKLGASFDFRPLALGVSATLPSLNLFGRGRTYYNDSAVNIDLDGDGTPSSSLTTDYQDDLDTEYKSPASVSLGTSYGYRTATIHLSVEYFGGVPAYSIIEPLPLRSQSTGDSIAINVTGGMRNVFNAGIGLDYKFSDRFSLYAGFTTDRSAYIREVNTAISSWNLYHVKIGSAFRAFDIDWTAGFGFTWGADDVEIDTRFSSESGGEAAIGGGGLKGAVTYDRIILMLGFAFPSGKEN